MPQSTARKARGPTDLRSETSDPSLAWRLDPALQSVSQFGLVTLAPTTQRAMEKLWKDARKGRVLLCGEGSAPYLAGVVASPWGRVPKLNPDRTVS